MIAFDIYGFLTDDLNRMKVLLERELQVEFVGHESLNRGEYYLCRLNGGEKFSLQRNWDPENEEHFREKFATFPSLLFADGFRPERAEEVRAAVLRAVPGGKLLERRIL